VELVALDRSLDVASLAPMLEAGAEIGATRVIAAGDDADPSVVGDKLAAVCELARDFAMAVDVEFMPFRAVRSLEDAVDLIRRADQPNAHILLDALHFYRSGSSLDTLRNLASGVIGSFQICDGPRQAPADLAHEARNARLLPGLGELDLAALIAQLPSGLPIGVEVPMGVSHPALSRFQQARLAAETTQAFYRGLAARDAS
jgi:sugar phosphate isomerase/epimerase